MMEKLVFFCQGESHKATNKPCQDYANCVIDNDTSIAVLSDGHGGSRYFRSDVGSKSIVEITTKCVREFLAGVPQALFTQAEFNAVVALTTERKEANLRKQNQLDKLFSQLFASIIYNWRIVVEQHASANPFSDEELKLINNPTDPHSIDKTYGCTLQCFAATTDYWFAFQIGDGKCFAFDANGQWSEPIPWDERCFLNKTTSICDTDALSEFRYCYGGMSTIPVSVILASDGLDDSFGESCNQANFYVQILKLLEDSGNEKAQKEIEETLPQLSKIGSQDDMSIACIYDSERLGRIIPQLVNWQRLNVKIEIEELNKKITVAEEKYRKINLKLFFKKKDLIEAQYLQTEIERLYIEKRKLAAKYNRFSMEIDPVFIVPYNDEIGLYETKEEEERATLTPESIRKRLRKYSHPFYKFE